METVGQDLRFALRMLVKKPGFTIIAILALTLGIGANSAIFSVVNAVLLRPLPFSQPQQLVMVWNNRPESPADRNVVSYPDFQDWQQQSKSFSQLAAYLNSNQLLKEEGVAPEQLIGSAVSSQLLPLLNVQPILGRNFTEAEEQPNSEPVALLSYRVWQRRFNSDTRIIGKQINISNRQTTIIGILPADLKFPVEVRRLDLLMPLAATYPDRVTARSNHSLRVIGRLKDRVTIAQAQAEMTALAGQLARQYPDSNANTGVNIISLHENLTSRIRPALLMLLGAVLLVLLIACANVANLLLARATTRQREIGIRTALGATRVRIIRQLLTESVLLSLAGGGLGLLVALWGIDLLVKASPVQLPRLSEVNLDSNVIAFTMLLSILTGTVFGLVPALQVSRPDLAEVLKSGGRNASENRQRNHIRGLLVIAEVALSLVLLVGAGLLIKSFLYLQSTDPGFNAENLITAPLSLSKQRYPKPEQQRAFFQQLLPRLQALPGVESVGITAFLPMGGSLRSISFEIAGAPPLPLGVDQSAIVSVINADYFRAMRIPLSSGRLFTDQDDAGNPPVVIINEALARRYFANQDPIGQRLIIGGDPTDNPNPPSSQIIGVVGNVHQEGLDQEAAPQYYLSYLQAPERYLDLVVRGTGNSASLAGSLRTAIGQFDPEQFVPEFTTMNQVLAESIAQRRFNMLLIAVFASVALLLAVVGIYGVISYSVNQRIHEIGIRMALGAQPRDIFRLVVREGMRLTLIGIIGGLLASALLTRLISGLLYGVSALDPVIFLGLSVLLATIALLACYLPARRATRVDPLIALRFQ